MPRLRLIVLLTCLGTFALPGPALYTQQSKRKRVTQPRNYSVTYFNITSYTRAKDGEPGFDLTANLAVIKSKDKFIRSFADSFRTSIIEQWSIPEHSSHSSRKFSRPASIDDIPFETNITSHVSGSDSLLSLFVHVYEHGCCGASGSSEVWRTLNVDLHRKKLLKLSDILAPDQLDALFDEVKHELADAPIAIEVQSSGDFTDFRISHEGIEMLFSVSGGGRTWYETVFVRFKNTSYFREEFILNAMRLKEL